MRDDLARDKSGIRLMVGPAVASLLGLPETLPIAQHDDPSPAADVRIPNGRFCSIRLIGALRSMSA